MEVNGSPETCTGGVAHFYTPSGLHRHHRVFTDRSRLEDVHVVSEMLIDLRGITQPHQSIATPCPPYNISGVTVSFSRGVNHSVFS